MATCCANRKATFARSYSAALLMACGAAPDEPADASRNAISEDTLAALDSTNGDDPGELDREGLLAANQARIDELLSAAENQVMLDSASETPRSPEQNEPRIEASDDYGTRRASPMSASERRVSMAIVTAIGVAPESVSFAGQLVLIDGDAHLETAIDARVESLNKGKVLGQIVNGGSPPVAPVIYARVSGGDWSFNRPDLEQNVLLIADRAPRFVFEDFVLAVAAIVAASSTDCLGPSFMTVMRQSTFDAIPPLGKMTLRTKSVVYEPAACAGGYSACAQFPLLQLVFISPPGSGGGGGVSRERFVTGRRIGIDSAQVTSSSNASRAMFVHELLHTLGIAHPKLETLGSGENAGKLVVPGTLAGSCSMAPCEPGTNYPSIMHQASDLGRTNSLQPDDVDVINTLYTSSGGCGYRNSALIIVPR